MPGNGLPGSSSATERITPPSSRAFGQTPPNRSRCTRVSSRAMSAGLLARVAPETIPQQVDHQQRAVDEQPFLPQHERPQERHAHQVAQEQRRIAQRQQEAAAVADDEDEEDRPCA